MFAELKSVLARHSDTFAADLLGMASITVLFITALHLPDLL